MEKDLSAWIADLRKHRDRLASELERVDKALVALTGDTGPAAGRAERREGVSSASPMIDRLTELFDEHPNSNFTAESALKALEDSGWKSDATDPVNAMRTALSRMARRGDIRRAGRGVYRRRTQNDDRLMDQLSTDPWFISLDPDQEAPF